MTQKRLSFSKDALLCTDPNLRLANDKAHHLPSSPIPQLFIMPLGASLPPPHHESQVRRVERLGLDALRSRRQWSDEVANGA